MVCSGAVIPGLRPSGDLIARAEAAFELNWLSQPPAGQVMPPRRLTAILAADVAGYSRLMGADEEGTHERLTAQLGAQLPGGGVQSGDHGVVLAGYAL